eukprot:329854-Pyramimonas_sp.AAC.1
MQHVEPLEWHVAPQEGACHHDHQEDEDAESCDHDLALHLLAEVDGLERVAELPEMLSAAVPKEDEEHDSGNDDEEAHGVSQGNVEERHVFQRDEISNPRSSS